jgi:hypothetical protein
MPDSDPSDISPAQLDMIARTVVGEAGNQEPLGQAAVAHVILNRVSDGRWGNSPSSVVLAPNQFEAWSNPQALASIPRTSKQYQDALAIAKQVASGDIPDPTNGAMNYANVDTVQKRGNQSAMNWINGMTNVTKIGDHTFGNAKGNPPVAQVAQQTPSSDDILQQYLKPGVDLPQATAPAQAEPEDVTQIYLKPKGQKTAPVSDNNLGKGLAYGGLHALSNILSTGGQAAQSEMGIVHGVDTPEVPNAEDTFGILQKNVTGQLSPGEGTAGKLGRNVGEAIPYMLTMPSMVGIIPRLIQAGLIGAGQTAGEKLAEGTPYEGAAGALGAIAAPLSAPYLAGKVMQGGGNLLANVAGGFSGVGPTPVAKAFTSGAEGGASGQAFRSAMSGNMKPEDIVDQANSALTNMRIERGNQYTASMKNLAENNTPLSFDGIDKAMAKLNSIKTFKGQSLAPETQDVQDQVNQAVNNWKGLDPNEYHTPIGMDALKQRIGSIKDNLPYNTPQRKVAEDAYSAVRKTIVDQAPQYADTMAGYEDASNQIDEIKKTLSLNPKASIDTSFRKLLSTMRNNANTNYGQRASLVQQLEQNGAPNLSSSLAGQSMQSWLPRGLAGIAPALELPLAGYQAYQSGGIKGLAAMAAVAPLQSPRIVGNASHALGRLYGSVAPSLDGTLSPVQAMLNMARPQSQLEKLLNGNVSNPVSRLQAQPVP